MTCPTSRRRTPRCPGGKAVQAGPRARLPQGVDLGQARRHDARRHPRRKSCSPAASCRCRTPTIPKAACCFPKFHIDEIKKQEGRDLTRFDLDFDLPDHLLPEFPPPIFLTTRPDLGDVSQGKLVTIDNFYELFKDILNPKQLEGLRLLVTPFPQQQFNQTDDRRSERASRGVTCFDCHVNGHTNGATHLVGDIRPQEFRHRIETPSLRGVNIQRLFGSQRALKIGRGLHRVRAAGRLLRRRPDHGHEEGRQHPGARQPGPLHGRVPGAARLPAGAEAQRARQARSRTRPPKPSCAARSCSSARPSARCATRPRTTPTT